MRDQCIGCWGYFDVDDMTPTGVDEGEVLYICRACAADAEADASATEDYSDTGPCLFPGRCCMPADHSPSECHTAEMLEDYENDVRV